MHKTTLRWAAGLALLGSALLAQAAPPKEVRLDYAYYAPTSLVLREQGLLEKRLGEQGIAVRWVFSQGSNRSLEYLNSGSTDFASTAGLAALLSRANGAPIETLYLASRPEWTALVTRKDTGIAKVEDLKGKRVAVTRGTDPHIFLVRALQEAKLTEKDVKLVLLQHPDGRTALERGDVGADRVVGQPERCGEGSDGVPRPPEQAQQLRSGLPGEVLKPVGHRAILLCGYRIVK